MHYKNLSLENIEGEEWRDVEGYEQFYQASNMGRIKSKRSDREYPLGGKHKTIRVREYPEIIKKQYLTPQGYLSVCLSDKVKATRFQVHRIIGLMFVLNPEKKPFINHEKGIRTDNRATELRWVTKIENEQHAWKVLKRRAVRGEENGKSKLTAEQVKNIRAEYFCGISPKKIAEKFGISDRYVVDIGAMKVWKHIPTHL